MSSTEGIGEVNPRQLAPSVGTEGTGSTIPVAVKPGVYNSSARSDPIYFGSFNFTPHAPVHLPAYSLLKGTVDLILGSFHLTVSPQGITHLLDVTSSRSMQYVTPRQTYLLDQT